MTAIVTNILKNISTWANTSKNVSTTVTSFLLRENGDYLLRETFDKILIDSPSPGGSGWVNQTKN